MSTSCIVKYFEVFCRGNVTILFLTEEKLSLNRFLCFQGTAYALMVYMTYNRMDEAENIMEWLQSQRQTVNAWVGTQV